MRALRHHEATMEARERDTTKYDPQYDFSFLAVCRLGKIKPIINKIDNDNLNPNVQARASVPKNKATAAMRTYHGQKHTEPSKSFRPKTARGQPPITRVEVSKINTKSTSLNKPPQVEEVETRKIADPTTKEDVEASEEDTTEVSEDDKAAELTRTPSWSPRPV